MFSLLRSAPFVLPALSAEIFPPRMPNLLGRSARALPRIVRRGFAASRGSASTDVRIDGLADPGQFPADLLVIDFLPAHDREFTILPCASMWISTAYARARDDGKHRHD